ncbi:MAG TPA: hypothetical protein VGO59_13115 [Verrucomicrobiae bacterium]|jgi:hypothetical protein
MTTLVPDTLATTVNAESEKFSRRQGGLIDKGMERFLEDAGGQVGTGKPLCLATCFLPMDERNCVWWRRLEAELAARGWELVLIGTEMPADRGLRVIQVPLWLQGYFNHYHVPDARIILEPSLAKTLAERDRTWSEQSGKGIQEFLGGVGACQHVLRMLLRELQPSAVLVFGCGLPQSVILQHLSWQHGLPCWILERGLLPGSLMLEMNGHGAQTELNWSFALRRAALASQETDLFFKAQESLRSRLQVNYKQAEYLDAAAFARKFNPERRKVVALLLQLDAGACLTPREHNISRVHSPGYASSADAIERLGGAVARETGALLLVKPHPTDRADYSHLQSERVRIVRDINLHNLIEAADAVACMTSTTQFEALLYEKPLLLLARSPLAGKGAAYEAITTKQLTGALRQALAREGFAERMEAGRRFLTFVLKHFTIALSDQLPAGSSLGDFAQFLAANEVAVDGLPPVADRLNAAGAWLNKWTELKRQTAGKAS